MKDRYDQFRQTKLGERIIAIIETPQRLAEFAAFSREGFPAVTALVSELSPVLTPLQDEDQSQYNFAKQFVGHHVGEMMRNAGFEKVSDRKPVRGKLFSYGALWGRR